MQMLKKNAFVLVFGLIGLTAASAVAQSSDEDVPVFVELGW